jgi:hypothetical protein
MEAILSLIIKLNWKTTPTTHNDQWMCGGDELGA